MEYNLEDIIKKCDVEKLIEGELSYEDNLPYESSDIGKDNENCIKMKYLEGSITKEEHMGYTSDEEFYEIYQNYIFNEDDVFAMDLKEEDKDKLIIYRMLLNENSLYKERFNQIMIRLYFEMNEERLEMNEERLKGLVQQIYDEYGWAKEYIEKHSGHKRSLIFRPNDEKYNEKYGIKEEQGVPEENYIRNTKNNINPGEEDWILKKFGG